MERYFLFRGHVDILTEYVVCTGWPVPWMSVCFFMNRGKNRLYVWVSVCVSRQIDDCEIFSVCVANYVNRLFRFPFK